MSDFRPLLQASFINRRTGQTITSIPVQNHMSLNKDLRQLCDSFDFDVTLRRSDSVDLRSHDFVEFYFMLDGEKFQVSAGFVEDLTKEVGADHLRFQANGRDFLGQLFNLPFLQAKPFDSTTLPTFTRACIQDAYLAEYLGLRGISPSVVQSGGYTGPVIVPELSDAKRGPILQQTADEVFTVPYQNRFGQVVLWGRGPGGSNLGAMDSGQTLRALGDPNVLSFTLRQNYSKVFSEVKVFYTGAEGNVDYKRTPSGRLVNTDPRAQQIFQPEVRTFQTSTLVNTAGQISLENKKNQLAASILRKSNQNLDAVVIQAAYPFFVTASGSKLAYEVNQTWNVESPADNLKATLRIVGIGYSQDENGLRTQLMLVGTDTLT